jgi:hypothetical protein
MEMATVTSSAQTGGDLHLVQTCGAQRPGVAQTDPRAPSNCTQGVWIWENLRGKMNIPCCARVKDNGLAAHVARRCDPGLDSRLAASRRRHL